MHRLLFFLPIGLLGCAPDPETEQPGPPDRACDDRQAWYPDIDGDGWGDSAAGEEFCDPAEVPAGWVQTTGDCDDTSTWFHPGAREDDCTDPSDYNCDGSVMFEDGDGDGFGACEDCDDDDGAVFPGAPEVCDGVDQDCDGRIDDDPSDGRTFYADADGDGFGLGSASTTACALPRGYAEVDGDCDDLLAVTHPGADEVCDEGDNDCDGAVDEDAVAQGIWYPDADGDGHGDPLGTTVEACSAPEGFSQAADDCDDADGEVSPSTEEICDGIDNDCDGEIDVEAVDETRWYIDRDGDDRGDEDCWIESCSMPDQPDPYVTTPGDCDDYEATVSPDQVEICDGLDNDCDGDIDADTCDVEDTDVDTGDTDVDTEDGEGGGGSEDTEDTDEDGSGGGDGGGSDDGSGGGGDTADTGDTEEGGSGGGKGGGDDTGDCSVRTWYADVDGDAYGDVESTWESCEAPSGYVANHGDCDDADPTVRPYADEVCDEVDNDCDELTDEGVLESFYLDVDGDGFGDPSTELSTCEAPSGYLDDGTDCDDADSDVYPGAEELLDWSDSDCDGIGDNLTTDDADAVIYGESKNLRLGEGIAALGDLDGDGADDLLVGGRGMTYVVLGGQSGSIAASSGPASYEELEVLSRAGSALANVGDLDGDGYAEILIGAPRYNGDIGSNAGQVYLLSGETLTQGDTSVASAMATFTGETQQDRFGDAVGGADGTLYIGAARYDGHGLGGGGAVYVMSGTLEGAYDMSSPSALIVSEAAKDYVGENLSLGDMDGDGSADLLVGARGQDAGAGAAGAAYVLSGPFSGTIDLSSADAKLLGDRAGDDAGTDVDLSHDLDGDGYADAVIGAPSALSDKGRVYVVYGPWANGVSDLANADAVIDGHEQESGFGAQVQALGDVDGDGVGDLSFGVITADDPDQTIGNVGGAWIVLGPHVGSMSTATADASLLGLSRSTDLGYRLAPVGDWNGDGYADLALTAPKADPNSVSNAGEVYLFLGYP